MVKKHATTKNSTAIKANLKEPHVPYEEVERHFDELLDAMRWFQTQAKMEPPS